MCIVTFIMSCNIDGNDVKTNSGRMRIINASYKSQGINVRVDYKTIYDKYTEYLNFSKFREFLSGKHKVHIDCANGTVLETDITIDKSESYTLFIYDSLGTTRYFVDKDNFVVPKGANSKVRFVNVSNDAQEVNVFRNEDATPHFLKYTLGRISTYITYPRGNSLFRIEDSGSNLELCTPLMIDLQPGLFYTMLLKGRLGSVDTDSLGLFVISENGNYE